MRERKSSIQKKLMRLGLLTSSVVLVLTCTGFFTYEYFTFRQASKDRLSTLGEIISENSTAALAFQSAEHAEEILDALKAEHHIVAAVLYDRAGNVFAKYPLNLKKENVPVPLGKDGYNYVNSHLEGFQPVVQKGRRLGTLYLQSDMKAIYQRFERYAIIALLVILISVIVAYLLAKKLQKTISEPIFSLATTADKISIHNDYTARAMKFDEDELGTLTDAFNKMLSQIEKQNAEIRGFNHALELKINERTTELEQANNELRLKSDFEETVIDSSIDMIAVFDKDFNYVMLNKYATEAFGLEGKNVIGQNILHVFPKLKESIMYQHLQQTFATGKMLLDKNYQSNVSDRIMENYFVPLVDKDGIVYRVLLIGHDITEISHANERLKMVNEEIEKSNHDLEQFAYVASHDLQEPLRKIQTFSQLLEKKLDDKETVRLYISKIISSAARMTDLIKAVLDYSRLSNEKGQFEYVDLNEVVDNIRTDLEVTIQEKAVEIKAGQLPTIWANQLQMNQLFLNLISNSIKFSARPPEIIISSRYRSANEVKAISNIDFAGPAVELIFQDNGIGFEQAYADKIFTVFQRLHGKQEYPGTGIGLALCKKIINNHHGAISVSSSPGEGTTFNILLPGNTISSNI